MIKRVRQEEPAAYLRTVASFMPKKVEVDAAHDLSHLTDAQLVELIRVSAERDRIKIPAEPAVH